MSTDLVGQAKGVWSKADLSTRSIFGVIFGIPSILSAFDFSVEYIKSIQTLIEFYRKYISYPIADTFHGIGIYIYPRTADVLVIFAILTSGFLGVVYKDCRETPFKYKKTLKKLIFWILDLFMVAFVVFYNEGWVFTISDIKIAATSGWRLSMFDVIPLLFVTLLPMLFYNINKFTKYRSDIFSLTDLYRIYAIITLSLALALIMLIINHVALKIS